MNVKSVNGAQNEYEVCDGNSGNGLASPHTLFVTVCHIFEHFFSIVFCCCVMKNVVSSHTSEDKD